MKDTITAYVQTVRDRAQRVSTRQVVVTMAILLIALSSVFGTAIAGSSVGGTLIEGFEDGDMAEYTIFSGDPTASTENPYNGTYSMKAFGDTNAARSIPSSSKNISFAVYPNSIPTENKSIRLLGGGGFAFEVAMATNGNWTVEGADSQVKDIGEYETGKWYVFHIHNISSSTDQTFDLSVRYGENATLVNEVTFTADRDIADLDELQFIYKGEYYVDDFKRGGTEIQPVLPTVQTAENLTFDVRNYMEPNSSHPYTVYYYNNTTDDTTDVTQNATLTIENVTLNGTQVLTSPSKGSLSTINNSTVAATVNLSAEYDTGSEVLQQNKTVVVAAPTVENLAILPDTFVRSQAVFGDSTLFALMIAAILSVAASRFVNAFAGLAAAEVVVVIGWFAGFVGLGITLLSVFLAIFLGLNLAENTVQLRGG